MKHEKEWYSCDRCGKNIEEIPSSAEWKHFIRRGICKTTELKTLTVNRNGYIPDAKLISPEITSMEIVESYLTQEQTIHLCGKCRKDFERFMKNE